MLSSTPLALPDVALLVALVKPGERSGRAWGTKARLILALATYPDGDRFGGPEAELHTGIPRGHARHLLAELDEQRVIVRRGPDDGRGSNMWWVEVNPEWRRWEVDWAMEHREIELRLTANRAERVLHPFDRFITRFSRLQQPRFLSTIAVLRHRDFERQSAGSTPFSRLLGSAILEPESRPLEPRFRRRRRQGGSPTWDGDVENSSSSSPERAQEEEGRKHPGWGRVRAAYAARAGVPALFPNSEPGRLMARLLAQRGDEVLLEQIERAPDGLGVKQLGHWLEDVPDAGPAADLATVTTLVTEGRAARAHLESLVATYEREGGAPPKELLDELARWQDDVDAPQEVHA